MKGYENDFFVSQTFPGIPGLNQLLEALSRIGFYPGDQVKHRACCRHTG